MNVCAFFFATRFPEENVLADVRNRTLVTAAALGATLLLIVICIVFVSRHVTDPIVRLKEKVVEVGSGNLDVHIDSATGSGLKLTPGAGRSARLAERVVGAVIWIAVFFPLLCSVGSVSTLGLPFLTIDTGCVAGCTGVPPDCVIDSVGVTADGGFTPSAASATLMC